MIVSTINVNGIRAAIKQRSSENLGLLPWLEATTADVVCLQETRADDKLAGALAPALYNGPPRKLAYPQASGIGGRGSQRPQRCCGAEPASDPVRAGSW